MHPKSAQASSSGTVDDSGLFYDDLPPFVRLASLGYPVTKGLGVALHTYQAFHGLPVTGELDQETKRHLELPRFCGLPDIMTEQLSENLCKWKKQNPSTG